MKDVPWEDPDQFLKRLRSGRPKPVPTMLERARRLYAYCIVLCLVSAALCLCSIIHVHGACK